MSRNQIVVIGAGTMGELHANVVANHSDSTLGSVVDIDGQRAQNVAEEFDTSAETDPADALGDADGCIIATPEPTHADLVATALSRDCAVLLEKPIAHSRSDARRIHERAKASDNPVLLGHLLRFDPRYTTVKDRIENDEFGNLLSVSARRAIPIEWSRRMGERIHPVKQITTHDFDLLSWFTDSDASSVYAVSITDQLTEFGMPDVVQSVVEFETGPVATIETHGVWPAGFSEEISARLEVTGTTGGARVTAPEGGLEMATDVSQSLDTGHWPSVHGRIDGSLRRQFDHFLRCIRGTPPLVSTTDALHVFAITEAVIRSLEQGAAVSPEPLI